MVGMGRILYPISSVCYLILLQPSPQFTLHPFPGPCPALPSVYPTPAHPALSHPPHLPYLHYPTGSALLYITLPYPYPTPSLPTPPHPSIISIIKNYVHTQCAKPPTILITWDFYLKSL